MVEQLALAVDNMVQSAQRQLAVALTSVVAPVENVSKSGVNNVLILALAPLANVISRLSRAPVVSYL